MYLPHYYNIKNGIVFTIYLHTNFLSKMEIFGGGAGAR